VGSSAFEMEQQRRGRTRGIVVGALPMHGRHADIQPSRWRVLQWAHWMPFLSIFGVDSGPVA
jgi:hypothetical protein